MGLPGATYPADPQIAAGPSNLLLATNDGFALETKDGTQIAFKYFGDFFGYGGYDPRVLYDPHSGRFIAVALDSTLILVAVSKTSTPTNLDFGSAQSEDWWRYSFDGSDNDGGTILVPDFDGLGADQYNLYLAANMYKSLAPSAPSYAKVYIIPKSGPISGGPLTVYTYGSPPAPFLANPVTGHKNFNIEPSLNFDATAEHMIAVPLETVGAFGRTTLWTVVDAGGTPTLASTDLLLPNWTGPAYVDCSQLGGGDTIDGGLVGTMSVVERGGHIWAAHTAPRPGTPAGSEIHWYELDPSGPTTMQAGVVSDPVHCYFYSAITVNSADDAALVMSGVDPTIYPSIFYTARFAGDAAGTMQPVGLLQAGLGNWSTAAPGSRNRWGDYGGAASDPATDSMWLFHMYTTGTNRYATWVGEVSPAPQADQLLPGHVAVVKAGKLVKFVAKAPIPSVFALPNASNDPSVHGATIRFFDTIARANGDLTFSLPAGPGWKRIGSASNVKGYKYKGTGTSSDPCTVVLIKPKVVKAVCKGTAVGFTLPVGGNLGVVLTAGSAERFCADFGGTSSGNPALVFKRKGAQSPNTCPSAVTPTPPATPTETPANTALPTGTPTPTGTG